MRVYLPLMRIFLPTEASDRKIYLPVKVGESQKKGGWVWSKIYSTKTDLATTDHQVASWWRRKDRQTHDFNAQDPYGRR
jgi:hypothetical protein